MPKKRDFEWIISDDPTTVTERLRRKTRFRPLPHTTSVLGRGLLGGRVHTDGFVVSTDDRVLWQSMRPVARATVTPTADGRTRVSGTMGLPDGVTWLLRGAMLLVPLVLAFMAYTLVTAGAGAIGAGLFAAMLVLTVLSVGRQVAHADAGLDELETRLHGALSPPMRSTEEARETTADPHGNRRREGQRT